MEIYNVCCICVEITDNLQNVILEDHNNIKYCEKLALCDTSQDWHNENIRLCENCIEKLNLAYEFIMCCKQSKLLREEKYNKLQQIEQDKANKQELIICDICKKSFKQKRFLKLHITKMHMKVSDDKEKVETQDNNKESESSETRNKDLNFDGFDESENDDLFHESDNVNDDSEFEEKFKPERKKVRQKQEPFTCSYCGKLFNRRQHWSAHIRSIHTFEKPYKCNLCEASFSNSHSLLVHKRNHRNEKPYICSTCGKGFVCSGDLNHHNKIHLNKREYQCTICDKRFNTSSILRTHKIVKHTDPKDWKYACAVCHRRFALNSGLAVHMKRHSGVKDCMCHICEKKFFNKSELTKHILTHSNQRNFKCIHCDEKEYKNREGLNKHLKTAHNIGNWKRPKPEKKYLCPMCPKLFTYNNKLQRHLLSHTGEKPFNCEYCGKKFVDNYYRRVHLKKDHNIKFDDDHPVYYIQCATENKDNDNI
ncbi:uncharacterized protein LOC143193523 [Rhynchophorus ferrugineus]|uniref:uncharacterized protein LOC143193523 n=1 Tax=Rhynchophorus ferrugineus TaxID=354439 RepID=UPI003FCEDF30